jgi:hypothetical protein
MADDSESVNATVDIGRSEVTFAGLLRTLAVSWQSEGGTDIRVM